MNSCHSETEIQEILTESIDFKGQYDSCQKTIGSFLFVKIKIFHQ